MKISHLSEYPTIRDAYANAKLRASSCNESVMIICDSLPDFVDLFTLLQNDDECEDCLLYGGDEMDAWGKNSKGDDFRIHAVLGS